MKDLERKLQSSLIPNKLQKEVLEYVRSLESEILELKNAIDSALEILKS